MSIAFATVFKEEEVPEVKPPLDTIGPMLAARRFDINNPPPEPVSLFELAGHSIATAENIMVVQAKIKSGKSAAVGAMLAAPMEPDGDCLGFTATNPKGLAVIHFDTEQSASDFFKVIKRTLRRAGRTTPPAWLYSYRVKGLPKAEIKKMIVAAMAMAAEECGGIYCVIIDGVADLCVDVNNPAETDPLVEEIESWAVKYTTLLVGVIHENHGTDSGKTRGHFGSQLARKAETNLRLEKGKDEVTVIFADAARSAHFTKENGPRFRYCQEAQMHVSVGATNADEKGEEQHRKLAEAGEDLFGEFTPKKKGQPDEPAIDAGGTTRVELIRRIMALDGLSSSGARTKFDRLREARIIKKTASGDWILT